MKTLQGKTLFITGGSRGIGREIAPPTMNVFATPMDSASQPARKWPKGATPMKNIV